MEIPENNPNQVAVKQEAVEALRFAATDKVRIVGTIPVSDVCLEVSALKKNSFRNFWLLTYGVKLLQWLLGGPRQRLAPFKD